MQPYILLICCCWLLNFGFTRIHFLLKTFLSYTFFGWFCSRIFLCHVDFVATIFFGQTIKVIYQFLVSTSCLFYMCCLPLDASGYTFQMPAKNFEKLPTPNHHNIVIWYQVVMVLGSHYRIRYGLIRENPWPLKFSSSQLWLTFLLVYSNEIKTSYRPQNWLSTLDYLPNLFQRLK